MTVVGTVAATGAFYYFTQKDKHPGSQQPFDESKKTLVVLGSGWGATSLLKGLDTDDYNVVSLSRVVCGYCEYFANDCSLLSVAFRSSSARGITSCSPRSYRASQSVQLARGPLFNVSLPQVSRVQDARVKASLNIAHFHMRWRIFAGRVELTR